MHATGLVSHERYFWHDPGPGAGFSSSSEYVEPDPHPESPSTKRRMLSLLTVSGLIEALVPIAPRLATIEELTSFHTARYVERVRTLSAAGGGPIGDSATIGHGSFDIARLAAGGCIAAVDAVLRSEVSNAHALVRPPGHHAEPDRGRGYCVFGNAVIAVKHAQRVHRLNRIAVVDWDVHHGNGTELAFIDDPSVLTISVHQDRCYPLDSGFLAVVGEGRAANTNLNVPCRRQRRCSVSRGSGAFARRRHPSVLRDRRRRPAERDRPRILGVYRARGAASACRWRGGVIEWPYDAADRMRLIDDLEGRLAAEKSFFRAQLLREDIARLGKLEALARATPDLEEYRRAGRHLGWTPMDARTHELGAALDRLLEAVRETARGAGPADGDTRALEAWIDITRTRLERMVGCLSTPAPQPAD